MRVLHYAYMVLLLVAPLTMRAQQVAYQSKLLYEIGKSIGYVPSYEFTEGTYNAGTVQGLPIIARYDNRHTVTNLGLHLFSSQAKEAYASDVYDFLERYFLELLTWKDKTTLSQKLKDDKVMFVSGSIELLRMINETTPYYINRVENKYYEVSWTKEDGSVLLSVAFPIQYELLLGMPQVEIANTMYDRIVGAPRYSEVVTPDSIQQLNENVYMSAPLSSYQLEDVNNALYFKKDNDKCSLLVDTAFINYSATNVLQKASRCNNPLKMEQSVYGFKTLSYTITLSQWINYCHSAGLTTYAAIEEEYDDALKVLVVAESKDLGYNHLLSFIVPRNFIQQPSAEIKCEMSAFIPTHNVKNLYQQYVDKPKKKY